MGTCVGYASRIRGKDERMRTFITETRARYGETDASGKLYYGSYLFYFEVGRMEMFRDLSLPYDESIPIAETHCRYLSPGYFDDLLEVCTRFDDVSRRSFKIRSEVYRKEGDEPVMLAEGYVTHVHIDGEGKASPLPDVFIRVFESLADDE